jgi:hypothetical protein
MRKYFECHITFLGTKEDKKLIEKDLKWKFSIIDGDPVLGAGVKCYATKHYPWHKNSEDVKEEVLEVGKKLRDLNKKVLRKKIEMVIWDTKQNSEIK